MAKTALKLNSTDGYGKDLTTTINYVNPEAGKDQMLEFTQALNALTTNTYKETEKVTTTNLDLEPSPSTPTISSSVSTISRGSWQESGSSMICTSTPTISYNGDGSFWISQEATSAGLRFMVANNDAGTGNIYMELSYLKSRPVTFPLTLTVGYTGTENYKACSIDITLA